MTSIVVPHPIVLMSHIRDLEERLVAKEIPADAGPLLYERYTNIYLLILATRVSGVNCPDINQFIASDGQAQAILTDLNNSHGLSKITDGRSDASRTLVFTEGGILSKLNKHIT